MADLSAGTLKLSAYWGAANAAAAQRLSTADFVQYIQDAAAAEGQTIAGANAIDYGRLRSAAVTNRNAAEALNAAPSPGTIDFTMMGSELFARDQASFNAAPMFIVRFEHNVLVNGEPVTVMRSDVFRGLLPPTKDALMQQLNMDAQLLGDEYNQTHVSIGSISINMA
jgi:hypothetical protein